MKKIVNIDKKLYNEAELLMLPHNNIDTALTLYLNNHKQPVKLSTNHDILQYHTNQHLYVISNEKIKEDDWFICLNDGVYCRIYRRRWRWKLVFQLLI